MAPSNGQADSAIDKRDFDMNRPLLTSHDPGVDTETRHLDSRPESRISARRYSEAEDGLLNDVVEEIVERDRRRLAKEVIRICSFALGVITCLGAGSITAFSLYGPLFLIRLHYTQLRVNAVSIAAGVSMYLPVSVFGYLCDRYTPSPLALFSGTVFGVGYLLAAIVYKSGPPPDAGGHGYPFWMMVVAFVCVGTATSSAFGLSGMWQSQVGTYLLYERLEDGSRGDVDVFRYFIFLAALLFAIGVVGTFGLRIVEEDEKYIDEAVEELERSGLLEESQFFRSRSEVRAAYGTFSPSDDNVDDEERTLSLTQTDEEREAVRREKEREDEERRKKDWLLNWETKVFLKDHTMWWLALGFFLVTGPGEAYINNLGTVVGALTPEPNTSGTPYPAGKPSTHVTTIALTSTIARLLTGSLSDLFAPPATHLFQGVSNVPPRSSTTSKQLTLSRLTFLLPSALLLSLGYLILASPLPLQYPELSHITTGLIGFGYGSAFSLCPIIISVVWGVENFGTNWGIVAMFPAAGAALWGIIYSRCYQDAADGGSGSADGQCHGWKCYGFWAVGCTLSARLGPGVG
ncbi:putative monocarboxylate transporter mch1 [Aspergillus hancockii]|nr:putative monocarboxylate transporter mch1 [Aspergillus hancockii]